MVFYRVYDPTIGVFNKELNHVWVFSSMDRVDDFITEERLLSKIDIPNYDKLKLPFADEIIEDIEKFSRKRVEDIENPYEDDWFYNIVYIPSNAFINHLVNIGYDGYCIDEELICIARKNAKLKVLDKNVSV